MTPIKLEQQLVLHRTAAMNVIIMYTCQLSGLAPTDVAIHLKKPATEFSAALYASFGVFGRPVFLSYCTFEEDM